MFTNEVRNDPMFANCHRTSDLAIKMVQAKMNTEFGLIFCLIRLDGLVLILPVATATVERAFLALKFVKTDARNKMGTNWLNHRMTCYIE